MFKAEKEIKLTIDGITVRILSNLLEISRRCIAQNHHIGDFEPQEIENMRGLLDDFFDAI
jgi:hypothetical protein